MYPPIHITLPLSRNHGWCRGWSHNIFGTIQWGCLKYEWVKGLYGNIYYIYTHKRHLCIHHFMYVYICIWYIYIFIQIAYIYMYVIYIWYTYIYGIWNVTSYEWVTSHLPFLGCTSKYGLMKFASGSKFILWPFPSTWQGIEALEATGRMR